MRYREPCTITLAINGKPAAVKKYASTKERRQIIQEWINVYDLEKQKWLNYVEFRLSNIAGPTSNRLLSEKDVMDIRKRHKKACPVNGVRPLARLYCCSEAAIRTALREIKPIRLIPNRGRRA